MNAMVQVAANIGRVAIYNNDGWQIKVRIIDAKQAYGTYRYQITPLEGAGSKWVQDDKLQIV